MEQFIQAHPMLAIGGLVVFGVLAVLVALSHDRMLSRHDRHKSWTK